VGRVQILDLILPTFAIIITGWLAARWRILPSSAAESLIQFAYYVAMPALLFATVAKESPGFSIGASSRASAAARCWCFSSCSSRSRRAFIETRRAARFGA
jgi:predicted permease